MRHATGLAHTATRATTICAAFLGLASASSAASAAQITFNDVVTGATSYAFDGDGDGIKDVTFSTTDPGGFRTIGPGLNQSYILEPGLEGTSLLPVDLRVDFAKGPTGTLTFAFALNSSVAAPAYAATFQVFDASGTLLGENTVAGAYTATSSGSSSFPEGVLSVSFAGTASYGLFNFTSQSGRYIIDNFTGNFGSAPDVPEPSNLALAAAGLMAFMLARARGRWRQPLDRHA